MPNSDNISKPPSKLYSKIASNNLVIDGACYTSPSKCLFLDEESGLVDQKLEGVNGPGCSSKICGSIGVYCYESINVPNTYIDVAQPLNFPSEYLGLLSNVGSVFTNPSFLYIPVGGTYADSTDTVVLREGINGDPWRYTSYFGDKNVTVIYGSGTISYDFISYNGDRYCNKSYYPGYGTHSIVSQHDVIQVDSCYPASSSGNTLHYADVDTGDKVGVLFNNLSNGIPFYGIASEVVNSGVEGLPEGSSFVKLSSSESLLISRCEASGEIYIIIAKKVEYLKDIITLSANGDRRTVTIGRHSNRLKLTVEQGDSVWIKLRSDTIGGKVPPVPGVVVSWHPYVSVPRKYDTAMFNGFSGTSSLSAIGFVGISGRTGYTYFSEFPIDEELQISNPNSVVSIADARGSNYVLARCRSSGEQLPLLPEGIDNFYLGEDLVTPIEFNFWATREMMGAHGEMDIWFNGYDGTFPTYLRSGIYRTLRVDNGTRIESSFGDISRNHLNVSSDGETFLYPRIFISESGRRVSFRTLKPVVEYQGEFFNNTLILDYGLSCNIVTDGFVEYEGGSHVVSLLDNSTLMVSQSSGNYAAFGGRLTVDVGDDNTSLLISQNDGTYEFVAPVYHDVIENDDMGLIIHQSSGNYQFVGYPTVVIEGTTDSELIVSQSSGNYQFVSAVYLEAHGTTDSELIVSQSSGNYQFVSAVIVPIEGTTDSELIVSQSSGNYQFVSAVYNSTSGSNNTNLLISLGGSNSYIADGPIYVYGTTSSESSLLAEFANGEYTSIPFVDSGSMSINFDSALNFDAVIPSSQSDIDNSLSVSFVSAINFDVVESESFVEPTGSFSVSFVSALNFVVVESESFVEPTGSFSVSFVSAINADTILNTVQSDDSSLFISVAQGTYG